ncbi:peptidase M23 [Vibrio sp. 10N.286.49.B3]|uniref:M23 family metallopeptidase n=1 Tax=Vibrio sp. 10N.286.49.B3 TaxID=1880855 RepID=UPI000C822F09|nr:M23 family metallopeptidase [Vibrio sp. 10N.286.49.B3]PMH39722.1 peptidase M23 [Vibrio sp. 10N.286.49.B3]
MLHKISVAIPTPKGLQTFYFGRTALVLIIATTLLLPTALGTALGTALYLEYKEKRDAQHELIQTQHVLQQQLSEVTKEKQSIENQYQVQVATTHSLSQDIADKNAQIQLLGKRVFDVETVLGLADEDLLADDSNLEERMDAAAIDSAVRATMFRLIPNNSPINYQRISSSYGSRTNPIYKKNHFHTGIDLTCKVGDEVVAPADGVIETVRPSKQGYGNFLTMRHSFGFMSSYAHLNSFKVRSGQFVSKGDVIALCGNTGSSTGPHLHYEVRFLGRTLNPQYLMDWTPDNFNYLFEKEKKVKWAPLVKLIDNMVRLQVNLTSIPYLDKSMDTAVNESVQDEHYSTN